MSNVENIPLGDHVVKCTTHSGVKKEHDLMVEQLTDDVGPVNLVLDLCIAHDHYGSSSNPRLIGNLHYPLPTDINKSLNEDAADKICDYRGDYNRPSNSHDFFHACCSYHLR